ncbi:transposase orfB for insertion sequence element [Rhodococcus ruber BKS 20-38]|uniref:Transposase orfB for insertion sequence element n=1 Tax=Rhodococcus ruber BKS 20-38 TaxID=1278076 RepID=M2WS06_9NOCA|nr:transposase [Rhodococcus ruber]EME51521.1 transposase orfB for insertion sequence element [Rhodococcus ruber BKS 20-38]
MLERLGQYRWKIKSTRPWLTGYRRLTIRYERHSAHLAGILQLAAALTCWKKLIKRDDVQQRTESPASIIP